MASSDIAQMAGADCAWAAELMQGRRAAYASYSPVFWRSAKGAVRLHTRFLQRQIARDDVTGLRTGHGFVIGELRRQEGFIDDFAVDDGQRWMDDGRGMLLAAWQRMKAQGARSLRVASAGRELPKNALLASVGLAQPRIGGLSPSPRRHAPREAALSAGTGSAAIWAPRRRSTIRAGRCSWFAASSLESRSP